MAIEALTPQNSSTSIQIWTELEAIIRWICPTAISQCTNRNYSATSLVGIATVRKCGVIDTVIIGIAVEVFS